MDGMQVYDPRLCAERPTPGEVAALARRAVAAPPGASLPHSGGGFSPVTPPLPAATSPRRQGVAPEGQRSTLLCGDHLSTVRRAVAATLPAHQPRLTERVLAGEADHLLLMRAAIAAVERVLGDLFA